MVHLVGKGLGCRNQELALAAAAGIAGLDNVAVVSVGSDGTDGPTRINVNAMAITLVNGSSFL